jgi:hypothetical protein
MTGNDAPPTAAGPPWPLELLADLHAGVFDEDTAAELHTLVAADPDARATLAALDATRTALAALPPLRIPDDIAARIDTALRDEAAGHPTAQPAAPAPPAPPWAPEAPSAAGPAAGPPVGPAAGHPTVAPVVDLAAARERRRRRGLLLGAGLLTAAAAVVGVIAVSGLIDGTTPGTPHAGTANPNDQALPPLAISLGGLGDALDDALSTNDYGQLGAAGRLDACLAANRLNPATTEPLGAREITLDGKPGILLVLPTGTAARFRLLVVSPDCGPGNPATLADTTVGR